MILTHRHFSDKLGTDFIVKNILKYLFKCKSELCQNYKANATRLQGDMGNSF